MPRDGRIRRIGQPQLGEAGRARGAGRRVGGRNLGEEAVEQEGPHFIPHQLDRERSADQTRAAARDRHRGALGRVGREQQLLGRAAGLHQRAELRRIQLADWSASACSPATSLQLLLQRPREQEVHVVAAQQQVIADGDALEHRRLVVGHLRADQRQVGGAAADVDDQHQRNAGELAGDALPMDARPVVEGGLRLFEEQEAGQPCFLRCPQGQRAGGFIKRRRHGDDQVLLRELCLGMGRVPGSAQVREDARARRHRREPRHFRRRAPGQDGRGAIDRRMAEPALRRGDMPTGNLRAAVAGIDADEDLSRMRFMLRGQIEVRRQERARLRRLRRHQLRHLEDADLRVLLREVGVRQRRVRGAEVDADGEAQAHSCLTENSSFQARPSVTSCISSVPTSVTCERRWTGMTSPALGN